MKKVVHKSFLFFAAILFFIAPQSCNQSGKNQDQTQSEIHEHEPSDSQAEHHEHESMASDSLVLNNGAKWKADAPTNKNAGLLIATGDQFAKKSNRTLEDYHAFGNDINAGINKMINECTMEGAPDQALHMWFLPVLKQTSTLKNATDTIGLNNLTSEMIHRLHIYSNYFE